MFRILVPVLALVLSTTACGPREAGVTERDHGRIFYWEITGAEATYGDDCTDDEEFREGSAPQFEENSFIIYRVADDGQTATSQDCTTTNASSCSEDVDAQVYDINGTELLYDPGPEVEDIEGSDCDLQNDQRWLLTDNGETMTAEIELLFNHVGDVRPLRRHRAAARVGVGQRPGPRRLHDHVERRRRLRLGADALGRIRPLGRPTDHTAGAAARRADARARSALASTHWPAFPPGRPC
jgi:hypothetical protein